MFGGDGHDRLGSGFGDDILIGGDGNDRMTDIAGSNMMEGGDGADVFGAILRINSAFGGVEIRVMDLDFAENDMLELATFSFGTVTETQTISSEAQLLELVAALNDPSNAPGNASSAFADGDTLVLEIDARPDQFGGLTTVMLDGFADIL